MAMENHKFVGQVLNVRRERTKWVKNEDGIGGHSEKDGYEEATIEVWVNVAELVRYMGRKAIANKTRRAKLQGGAVTLVATEVKRWPTSSS